MDVISLLENKIIISLKGHNNHIRTIRYFINNKNKNEYLISADDNKIVGTVRIHIIPDSHYVKPEM